VNGARSTPCPASASRSRFLRRLHALQRRRRRIKPRELLFNFVSDEVSSHD